VNEEIKRNKTPFFKAFKRERKRKGVGKYNRKPQTRMKEMTNLGASRPGKEKKKKNGGIGGKKKMIV